jgi:4-hydroxy-tetrahydrodipicolinate synthase
MTTLPRPLRGIIPPMVTPLSDPDRLDHQGLERLIEHILAGGVHGLFILGTCGEGPSLSHRLRCELIEATVERVAGRVPVLVGITESSPPEAIDLAGFAGDAGAHAVVCAPPFYFPASQDELVDYFLHLAGQVALPLVLYNLPGLTKTPLAVETVSRLLPVDKIIGIKDSSGDLTHLNRLCLLAEQRPGWSVFVGPEELLAQAVFAGAQGGVCGGANVFPRLYVELYETAARGDFARAAALHREVMRVSQDLYPAGAGAAGVIRGLKMALSYLGVCPDRVARPLRPPSAAEREAVRERMTRVAHRRPSPDAVAEAAP